MWGLPFDLHDHSMFCNITVNDFLSNCYILNYFKIRDYVSLIVQNCQNHLLFRFHHFRGQKTAFLCNTRKLFTNIDNIPKKYETRSDSNSEKKSCF